MFRTVVAAGALVLTMAAVAVAQDTSAPQPLGPNPGKPGDRYTTRPSATIYLCRQPFDTQLEGAGPSRCSGYGGISSDGVPPAYGPGPSSSLGDPFGPSVRARPVSRYIEAYDRTISQSGNPIPMIFPVFQPEYTVRRLRRDARGRMLVDVRLRCPQRCRVSAHVLTVRGQRRRFRAKRQTGAATVSSWRYRVRLARATVRRGTRVIVELDVHSVDARRRANRPSQAGMRGVFTNGSGRELLDCDTEPAVHRARPPALRLIGRDCTGFSGNIPGGR